jgi:SAM-dependent methyltransferase
MSFAYELMYRVGFTPWERAGESGSAQLRSWLGNESPHGRALDVGCGTGRHTLELAERGWEAVGIDNVQRAVERARRRPGSGKVTFIRGDVTRLADHVQGPFSFFLDIGCFHGLTATQRAAVGSGITEVAAGDATLLMMAFGRNNVPVLPKGAGRAEIEEAFPGWRIDRMEPASTERMPKPIQATNPSIYRLVRT